MSALRAIVLSVAFTAFSLGSIFLPSPAGAAKTCDPVLTAQAQEAVANDCPCAARPDGSPWGKQRWFKKCVRTTIRDQVRASNRALLRRCLRETVRCTNRSTCGRDGAVTCTIPPTGVCTNGLCSNDPGRTCAIDDDCTVASCHIEASAAACNGSAGLGTCCDPQPLQ